MLRRCVMDLIQLGRYTLPRQITHTPWHQEQNSSLLLPSHSSRLSGCQRLWGWFSVSFCNTPSRTKTCFYIRHAIALRKTKTFLYHMLKKEVALGLALKSLVWRFFNLKTHRLHLHKQCSMALLQRTLL